MHFEPAGGQKQIRLAAREVRDNGDKGSVG
jgi:hypothetical protein